MFGSLNIASVKRRPSVWITLPSGERSRGVQRVAFRCGCRCEVSDDWLLSIRLCGWLGTTADGARICPTTDWAMKEFELAKVVQAGALGEVA